MGTQAATRTSSPYQPPPQGQTRRLTSYAPRASGPLRIEADASADRHPLPTDPSPGPPPPEQPAACAEPRQDPSRGWGTKDVIKAVHGDTTAPATPSTRCVPKPKQPAPPQPEEEEEEGELISFSTLLRSARAATSRDSARGIRASRGALPFVAPDIRRAFSGKMMALRQGGPRRELAKVLATVLAHAFWAHLEPLSPEEAWAQMQRKAAESKPSRAPPAKPGEPRVQPNGPDPVQGRADLHGGVLNEDAQLAWAVQARPHILPPSKKTQPLEHLQPTTGAACPVLSWLLACGPGPDQPTWSFCFSFVLSLHMQCMLTGK